MGIFTRDYYRDGNSYSSYGAWGLEALTPVVKYLIVANIAVFLLQIFIVREVRLSPLERLRRSNPEIDRLLAQKEAEGPEALEEFKKSHPELLDTPSENDLDSLLMPPEKVSLVQEWLQLDTRKVIHNGQVWRLLTHAFCHDRFGVFHILLNMIFLYWFGCTLETMYGGREFLLFYLTAAVMAALAFVGLDLWTGSATPAVGASGAVLAVTMLYTVHFPREEICVFWIIPVEMRWVMAFYVVWDLHPVLLALAGERHSGGVAHAAHLGGLLFGFLYGWYEWRLEPLLAWLPGLHWKMRPLVRVRRAPAAGPRQPQDPEMGRVDVLLEKISAFGQDSLSEEERTFLRDASARIRTRLKRDS